MTLIDDCYNANPTSMAAALDLLRKAGGRRIFVAGAMAELGPQTDDEHRSLGEQAAVAGVEMLVAVGADARPAQAAAEARGVRSLWFGSAREAAPLLARELRAGDTVLIKGSRSAKLELIAEQLMAEDSLAPGAETRGSPAVLYYLVRAILKGEHYVYENSLFRGVCAALFCFGFVLLVGKPVIRQLVRFKLGDNPEFDHATLNELMKEKSSVPTMGGILILASVALAVLLFADIANFYVQMGLFCLLWLGILGAADDWLKLTAAKRKSRDGLYSYEKLLFQLGLGVILGWFVYSHGKTNFAVVAANDAGEIEMFRVLSVPFYKQGVFLTPLLFMFITVMVTAFTSNAVNLTDGMDGLAAGCVAISALVFMLICEAAGDAEIAHKLLIPFIEKSGELSVICGAILGATAGFLWYNCHPARVFMGDTGSLPLGGVIGYVAIVTRQELMLFIVGGVFVFEALSVMLQVGYFKLSGGKRIFRCAPVHHHFHLGGWTETQTVVRFWLVAAVFAGLALASFKLR